MMLSYYQIKLLEKRIDYNDFAERTKINLIMVDATASKASPGRLRERIRLLGLV